MSTPRSYTVVGFNPQAGSFNCAGVAADAQLPDFVELTVQTQAKAIEALLTHPTISKMTVGVPPITTTDHLDTVEVTLKVNAFSSVGAREARKEIDAVIRTWAEKSRVRSVRGWRAFALRTSWIRQAPTTSAGGHPGYLLSFEVIFGHAVFYNDKRLSPGHAGDDAFINETVQQLVDQINRQNPSLVELITV